ncbi:MAG: hypothetical protein AAFR16_13125, partial [Pseudomonadota bacterium]
MAELASLVIPESSSLRRDAPSVVTDWRPDYDAVYDRRTLAYDVFHVPARDAYCMIAPRLLNLEPALRRAEILGDGKRIPIRRIRRYKRFEEIWLGPTAPVRSLTFRFDDFEATLAPGTQDLERFQGANALYTKSRNNRLDWIVDWARYHARIHNADSLVFVDNGSTDYGVEEIRAALAGIEGLRRATVIDAPFPFGVADRHETKFFQVAIMNMARRLFLLRARAVLCIDVDELIAPIRGSDDFADTVRSPFGYRLFRGRWLERDPNRLAEAPRHAQHVNRLASGGEMRATKYCIAPRGLL